MQFFAKKRPQQSYGLKNFICSINLFRQGNE